MAVSKIEPFQVEQWMDAYERNTKHNLAETCAASVSIDDLYGFAKEQPGRIFKYNRKLLYSDIRGSDRLRENIAALSSDAKAPSLSKENILITSGAIAANFLALYTLVSRGDHVICQHPTYQQLYSVPASLGAEVSLWRSRPENHWQLEIDELKRLLRPSTKLIILNNPQNPTGAIIPQSTLEQVVHLARERGIFILSDEVYRPLFHSLNSELAPPSILSFSYPNVIAVGSMSKAYALAGIRIGWIATPSLALIEAFAAARDYTTISVSMPSDAIAAYALSKPCLDRLLARNVALAKTNLALVSAFIDDHKDTCFWFKPGAGTTAFIRFEREGKPVDDVELCKALHKEKSVLVVPGSLCFGEEEGEFRGYMRIGYVCETDVLKEGLKEMEKFLGKGGGFEEVPLAS